MKNFWNQLKRICYTKIFILFNLSAVAFTFQACYGTMQDDWMDVLITGYVYSSETREPIPGIEVEVVKTGTASMTDEEGYFAVRSEKNSAYMLVCSDIDGEDNGSFWDKTTVLNDSLDKYDLSLKVMLNPKDN